MFALQRYDGKENKIGNLKNQKNDKIKKKTKIAKILGYMRRNVVNAKSSMSARQSSPFRKDGAFTDTSGRVKSHMMLVIEQQLNYITPKNTKQ